MSTALDLDVPPSGTPGSARRPARDVPADLCSARELHERLNAALVALGLDAALSPRWATPARSGFFFAPHNLGQADRLVVALELLGGAVDATGIDVPGRTRADPGPGQLSLLSDAAS